MRFTEVPYLEEVPYPTMFGPGSSQPLPRKFKQVLGRKRMIDADKVVFADTFKGLYVEAERSDGETSTIPEPVEVEFVELTFAKDLKIVTLNPDTVMWTLKDRADPQKPCVCKNPYHGKYDTSAESPMNERILETTKKFEKKVQDKDSWN